MKNVSFEAVRNLVANNAVQGVAAQATQATTKVVDAAKSVGNLLKGVAPVTVNGLDERTLELLKIAVINSMELQSLKDQLRDMGFQIEDAAIMAEEVDTTASAYLSVMKTMKKAKPQAQAPSQTTLEINVDALQQMMSQVSPQAQEPVQQAPAASSNVKASIPLSQPSNWHLGPQV